jgi:hypothetical protein
MLLVLVLCGIMLGLDFAGSDLVKTLKDLGEFLAGLDEYLVPVVNGLFGRDSAIAGMAEQLVEAANGLLEGLNALNGVLFLAGAVVTAAKAFMEGPMSLLLTAGSIALGGLMQLGSAYGFALINQSIEEQHEADEIGGETAPEWCANNPGACGAVNWNT